MKRARPFLDATVHFSAAWSESSRLRLLWEVEGADLLASEYVIEEARRNLETVEARLRLHELVQRLRVVPEQLGALLPAGLELREKDRPVFAAALGARATHFVTGDRRDFGPFLGQTVAGVLILTPPEFLSLRRAPARHR